MERSSPSKDYESLLTYIHIFSLGLTFQRRHNDPSQKPSTLCHVDCSSICRSRICKNSKDLRRKLDRIASSVVLCFGSLATGCSLCCSVMVVSTVFYFVTELTLREQLWNRTQTGRSVLDRQSATLHRLESDMCATRRNRTMKNKIRFEHQIRSDRGPMRGAHPGKVTALCRSMHVRR